MNNGSKSQRVLNNIDKKRRWEDRKDSSASLKRRIISLVYGNTFTIQTLREVLYILEKK